MIEELLWVVRLVRMIFSAGGYSKRVQITSDLHPLFFSGEIVRVFEGGHRWLLEAGGYLVAEDADSVCQRKKCSLFNCCTFTQSKTHSYETQIHFIAISPKLREFTHTGFLHGVIARDYDAICYPISRLFLVFPDP